jgi:hypothetical protein
MMSVNVFEMGDDETHKGAIAWKISFTSAVSSLQSFPMSLAMNAISE